MQAIDVIYFKRSSMSKLRFLYAFLALIVFMGISCKKDAAVYTVTDGNFAQGGLTATAAAVTLLQANENDTAVTFSWPAAGFGSSAVVNYTLQLDVPADTSGANAWGNAKTFVTGAKTLTYGFVTKELNGILNTLGLPTGTANKMAFRIKAEVPQYNGATSTIPAVYSNTLVLDVTSYGTVLYVPGDYQGWNPGAAPMLNPVDGRPGMFEGYVNITGTGKQYFKFTNAPDWDHINYGDGGNGAFSTDGNAEGLSVPGAGYYYLTADLNTNRWTATATTWGIIGDATPGGWDNDTEMSYDAAAQVWKLTANMKTAGSFKFRANKQWVIDFGIDGNGTLKYADNPFLGYTDGLNNLSVGGDGNYTITLDLHHSGKYTYSVVKN